MTEHPRPSGDSAGAPGPPDRRRRILHVSQPVGEGVAVVVRQLLQHQVALGWDVAVACPPSGALPEWAADAGATTLPWPASRQPGPSVVGECRTLHRAIREWAPDLVHLHSSKAGLVGRLVLRGRVPTVYQPHAWPFLAVSGPLRRASENWERLATRWTDGIAVVSSAERRAGEAVGVRTRWFACRNGVDLDAFHPVDQHERERLKSEHGLAPGPVVVCVGRLAPQKGQDLLLEAWGSLQVEGAQLVLVGDGPERGLLEARAASGVRLVGNQPDVRTWYQLADVVVQPSRWEAASLTLREAMASGCCIVVTDVAGVEDVMRPDAGAVVPVGDVGALTRRLRERLQDTALRAREGAAARRTALLAFDLQQTVGDVDRMYDEVLATNG